MHRYILIDNIDYCDFFLRYLRDKYVPIVIDERLKSLLVARGIECIGIDDHLSIGERKDINERASLTAEELLKCLDSENQEACFDIFGDREINLAQSTIKYLFIRFTMGALRMLRGLERIRENRGMDELAYLHDGKPAMVCGTKKERGFLFPDNIAWDIIKGWKCEDKPRIDFINGRRRKPCYRASSKDSNRKYLDKVLKLKEFIYPIKKAILAEQWKKQNCFMGGKTLLFMGPLYDLALHLKDLSRSFNIVRWDADGEHIDSEIIDALSVQKNSWSKLNFTTRNFNDDPFFDCLNYKELSMRLIAKFYELKLPDILRYWKQAESVHRRYRVDLVLWNNSPHRYPDGIFKEFFRVNGVPIVGMQHGGKAGTNEIARRLITTEFNDCDYYFSYGFTERDIQMEKWQFACSEIMAVGSSSIHHFALKHKSSNSARQKVNMIFPVQIPVEIFFAQSETLNPRIVEFQKKIIDILAKSGDKKIILKFPFGQYESSALGIYVENRYPKKFMIIDHLSFTKCLEGYDAETILIEEQSTPLNEAIATNSNIIVYNNPDWCGLTDLAMRLLSKRAVVCNGEGLFLETVKNALSGNIEKKDLSNKEFWHKFCVYNGQPEENIRKGIAMLIGTRSKEKAIAHAG